MLDKGISIHIKPPVITQEPIQPFLNIFFSTPTICPGEFVARKAQVFQSATIKEKSKIVHFLQTRGISTFFFMTVENFIKITTAKPREVNR